MAEIIHSNEIPCLVRIRMTVDFAIQPHPDLCVNENRYSEENILNFPAGIFYVADSY